MEAIASLSLACNVIQVIDFAIKATEICNEFYRHGTTVTVEALNETSGHLSQASTELERCLSAAYVRGPPTSSDAELASLSEKVRDAADGLQKELESLQVAPGSGRRAALGKTIKLKWRSSRVEEFKKRLDDHVKVLDTRILVNLRYAHATSHYVDIWD